MLLSWLKKHLPSAKKIKNHRNLRWMSRWLKDRPYLWEITKHSVAGGVAISLLVAFIPLPVEMILAALLALLFRVNLPVAILSTWLTNPVTFIPANYLIYKVGKLFFSENGEPVKPFTWNWQHFTANWSELLTWLGSLGKIYLVGLPIVSLTAALSGYCIVYFLWTIYEFFRGRKTS